jgi:hypothetical protein
MELLERLANLDPTLVWGLVSRGIGLVFLVSFVSLARQVLPVAGSRGITPVRQSLEAIERHFPSWKRFVYFPSLLWLNRSDRFLCALPWAGIVAALAILVGGPQAPWAFAVCYLAYLSLDRPMVLIYPWDCMLFEAGFWAMFLPATHVLPNFTAVEAPLPGIAWVYRLLVFRVMLGFGKHKFIGKTRHDSGFLKGFFINQPLPTPIGWLVAKLPVWAHKASLGVMFLVEIPAPFAVFAPGPASVVGALSFAGLMLAIALTGNFGYFNLVVIVLALSWFDTQTALAAAHGPLLINLLVLLHTACAFLSFPFNTFCAQVWMSWPVWLRIRPRFLTWPIVLIRVLHPLRWVHAYGVFPPRSPPPVKILPIIEATWDGVQWHTLQHRHSPSVETSRPTFCAPHHDRFDQAVVYEGLGINEASIMRNIVGRFDPYGHGGIPGPLMLLHRIVEGSVPGDGFYDRTLERLKGAPSAVRVRTHMFEASSLQELIKTGKWWRRTLVGPHFPPLRRGDGYWEHPLPPPELWHFDDRVWLGRSHLGRLMERSLRGENVHDLVLTEAPDMSRADVDEFWSDFVPAVCTETRDDWHGVAEMVASVRAKYGHRKLYRFERLVGRYGVLLFAKLEPLFLDAGLAAIWGRGRATLDVKTSHHLRLLCQHIITEGRATYDAVAADPRAAAAELERMTLFSGYYFQALLRYEALIFQCQKLRLMEHYEKYQGRPEPTQSERDRLGRILEIARRIFGPLEPAEFLKGQLRAEGEALDVPERWPQFALRESGKVDVLPSASDVRLNAAE